MQWPAVPPLFPFDFRFLNLQFRQPLQENAKEQGRKYPQPSHSIKLIVVNRNKKQPGFLLLFLLNYTLPMLLYYVRNRGQPMYFLRHQEQIGNKTLREDSLAYTQFLAFHLYKKPGFG